MHVTVSNVAQQRGHEEAPLDRWLCHSYSALHVPLMNIHALHLCVGILCRYGAPCMGDGIGKHQGIESRWRGLVTSTSSRSSPKLPSALAFILCAPSHQDGLSDSTPTVGRCVLTISPFQERPHGSHRSAYLARPEARRVFEFEDGQIVVPRCVLSSTSPGSYSVSATPSSSTTQDKLKELCNAIPQILQGKSTDRSLHFLSDTCHRLVLSSQDNGQDIYRHVKEELDKSVGLLAREWRAGIMGKEGGWVRRLVDGWKLWEAKVVS